ncbi:MAG: GNAT family N-acetyltransferase [Methylocystis sp.]
MSDTLHLPQLSVLPNDVEELEAQARQEGFNFVLRLLSDWRTGLNCFDKPGECLLGAFDGGRLVAVGGLSIDPYCASRKVGRLRRLYVSAPFRRRGLGARLVEALVSKAHTHFHSLRVRTDNSAAEAFYFSLGFCRIEDATASHELTFACSLSANSDRREVSSMAPTILATPRLRLRAWRDEDLAPFAALNADPRVMEFFPRLLNHEESDAFARRAGAELSERGFGLWAVEAPGEATFIGYVGLAEPYFGAAFTPAIEIGWRLAFDHWGQGYATEAARAVLAYGFERLALTEIVSYTSHHNRRSRAVMERLGMRHSTSDDFDHPGLPNGHPLQRHVLYRLYARNPLLNPRKD